MASGNLDNHFMNDVNATGDLHTAHGNACFYLYVQMICQKEINEILSVTFLPKCVESHFYRVSITDMWQNLH